MNPLDEYTDGGFEVVTKRWASGKVGVPERYIQKVEFTHSEGFRYSELTYEPGGDEFVITYLVPEGREWNLTRRYANVDGEGRYYVRHVEYIDEDDFPRIVRELVETAVAYGRDDE